MDLSKLPPFMTMTLGRVGCVAEPCLSPPIDPMTGTGSSEGSVDACLSPPYDESGSTGSTGASGTTDVSETFTTSACLSPPEPETDTGSSSGSGSGSGSDSGSDSGTSGMMADDPLPPTRVAAVERVVSRGTLPADVLDRLRAIASSARGR